MWAQWKEYNWPLEKFTWNSTFITDYKWRQSQYEPLTTCHWVALYLSSVSDLGVCFSSKSTITNPQWLCERASFQKQLGVWRGGYSGVGEVSRKRRADMLFSGTAAWVKIISLHYHFLKIKARIDTGGPVWNHERETARNKSETLNC